VDDADGADVSDDNANEEYAQHGEYNFDEADAA
jgi:hypothetical protein